jgi:toxin ParE1/3/4
MPKVRLILPKGSRRALAAITRESTRQFGEAQAKRYRAEFREAFARLREFPETGTLHQDLRKGIRRLPVGSHVPFYRFENNLISIVRILHQRKSEYEINWNDIEE